MGKKARSALTSRAWNFLRMALFWARKGGIFKRTAMLDFLKSPRPRRGSLNYYYARGEREFSFDDTPTFHFNLHRSSSSMRFLHIPCINPSSLAVDDEEEDGDAISRSSQFYDDHREFDCESSSSGCIDDLEGTEDEGIDSKAEEFIARFYEQMKLQRQISYLEYSEMLQRSVS